jgi:hypothetical protein
LEDLDKLNINRYIEINMPYTHFAKFLKSYSNRELIHIKVIYNKTKIAEYTYFHDVCMKTVLPKIKKNKIYSISLLYKEYGDYVDTEITEYYLFKDDNDSIYLLEPHLQNKIIFLTEIPDIKMSGTSTKKIVVEELNKRIFGVEIDGFHIEENLNKIPLFEKKYLVISSDGLDLGRILQKKIKNKYEYEILDLHSDENITMDEDLKFQSEKSINRIHLALHIKRKKGWFERLIHWFKS